MILKGESSERKSCAVLGRFFSVLSVLMVVGWAFTASATVTKTYILTPESGLTTPGGVIKLNKTALVPTWSAEVDADNDGTGGSPPAPSYGTDVAGVTQNRMVVEFSGPGATIDPNGTAKITSLDFHHDPPQTVPGLATIESMNDSHYSGAEGNLNGALQISTWNSNLVGQAHGEIQCTDIGGGGICGVVPNLPPSGDLWITHDDASELIIDTAGVPNAASLTMTFDATYDNVYMEITIDNTVGNRQYYAFQTAPNAVPTASETVQLTIMALLGLAGFFYLSRSQRKGMNLL